MNKNTIWMIIIGMFVLIFFLTGCSTVSGVGKDITGAAEWTKDKLGGSK